MEGQVVVLIAEDEELIRSMMVEALREEGFRVVEVEHAAGALNELNAGAHRFHLLFTDIHMPGEMNGLELAHHAATSWPWIALLITSGRPAPHPAHLPEGGRFISKPYRPTHVIEHILELTSA